MEVHAFPATTWDTAYQVEVAPTSKTADMWYWFFSLNDKQQEQQEKCTFEFPFFVILEEKDIFVFFIFSFLNPRFAQLTTSLEKKAM